MKQPDINTVFGDNCKTLRKQLNLTQQQFADRTGIPVKRVYHVENGLSVGVLNVWKVSTAFNISMNDLIENKIIFK